MSRQFTFGSPDGRTALLFRSLTTSIAVLLFCCLYGTAGVTFGQNIKYTAGNTDSALRSNLEVDPSTFGLSMKVSLTGYPGRGGELPITMRYNSKQWRIAFMDTFIQGAFTRTRTEGKWAEKSVAGWTTTLSLPTVEVPQGGYRGPYTGEGYTICTAPSCNPPPPPETAIVYINRLLLRMPDGSSHELRKDDSITYYSGPDPGVYYAVDGSNIRYETATSTVFMPDGSRWLLSVNGGTQAQCIDRNGNTMTYTFSTGQWTDTLGRNISFPISNLSWGDVTNSLPGVGTSTLSYTLRWRYLHESLSSGSVRVIGDYDYTYSNNPQAHTVSSLFTYYTNGGVKLDYVVSDGSPFSSNYFDPIVLKEIVLPNGKSYSFTYNVYGEIEKVVYPTGGYERFAYGTIPGLSGSLDSFVYDQANRGVTDRWVSVTGDGTDEAQQHWTYSTDTTGPYIARVISPDGTKTERLLQRTAIDQNFSFDDARTGMIYEERVFSAGGQMLRRTLTQWTASGALPGAPPTGHPTRNPRVTKTVEILLDTGGNALAKATEMDYDADLNVIETRHFDYASVNQTTAQTGDISAFQNGILLKTEQTTFLVNDPNWASVAANYRSRQLLALPTDQIVRDGAGVLRTETRTSYDEYTVNRSGGTGTWPLLTYGSVSGWIDPGVEARGIVTTVRRWLDMNSTWLVTNTQYDQCGSVRQSWDARGKVSQISYTDSFQGGPPATPTYAYATSVTTPVPDPAGVTGSSTAFTTTTTYDFRTGLVISTTDPNNVKSTNEYNDPLPRVTKVALSQGATNLRQTVMSYDDTARSVTSISDKDVFGESGLQTPAGIKAQGFFDGMGLTWRRAAYEGSNSWSVTDTVFDNMGRVWKVSNPYSTTNVSGPVNPSGLWTTTTYDALGRVLTVTTPDNSVVSMAYSGNRVLVTDQAGKQRINETDALGRLISVWEIRSTDAATVAVTFPNHPEVVAGYLTTYQYDALNNLRKVIQQAGTGGAIQTRYFAYDSLSRLVRVKNVEQGDMTAGTFYWPNTADPITTRSTYTDQGNSGWSAGYAYDANGNLIEKTDARNITTRYTYDALNRKTNAFCSSYPNDSFGFVLYYDGATNGKGKFWYNVAYNTESSGEYAYNYKQINGY